MNFTASIGCFGVGYASAGRGELEVTTLEDLSIAHASLLRSDVTLVGNREQTTRGAGRSLLSV